MNTDPRLVVGVRPQRLGIWLGVQYLGTWKPLAKFNDKESAEGFKELMLEHSIRVIRAAKGELTW